MLAIQEDAVQGNVKKAMKFDLKVFKELERLFFDFQFQNLYLAITGFISFSKPDRKVALHSALAEINTAGLSSKNVKCF